jgi:hypothetical protein
VGVVSTRTGYRSPSSEKEVASMRRIILLASAATVMAALILASAVPALAAPPSLTVTCSTPPTAFAIVTNDPQEYDALIAIYRNCKASGGTASIVFEPNPGKPTTE